MTIDFESIGLKDLKTVHFEMYRIKEKEHFFKDNNPELECFSLIKHDTNANDSIRLMNLVHVRLPMLKVLKLQNLFDHRMLMEKFHSKNFKRLKFDLLEKLKLSFSVSGYHIRTLQVIDCENLKKLHLNFYTATAFAASDDLITQMIQFKMLTSLQLRSHYN